MLILHCEHLCGRVAPSARRRASRRSSSMRRDSSRRTNQSNTSSSRRPIASRTPRSRTGTRPPQLQLPRPLLQLQRSPQPRRPPRPRRPRPHQPRRPQQRQRQSARQQRSRRRSRSTRRASCTWPACTCAPAARPVLNSLVMSTDCVLCVVSALSCSLCLMNASASLCFALARSAPKLEASFLEQLATLPCRDANSEEAKFAAQCTQNSRRRKNGWKKWRDTGTCPLAFILYMYEYSAAVRDRTLVLTFLLFADTGLFFMGLRYYGESVGDIHQYLFPDRKRRDVAVRYFVHLLFYFTSFTSPLILPPCLRPSFVPNSSRTRAFSSIAQVWFQYYTYYFTIKTYSTSVLRFVFSFFELSVLQFE